MKPYGDDDDDDDDDYDVISSSKKISNTIGTKLVNKSEQFYNLKNIIQNLRIVHRMGQQCPPPLSLLVPRPINLGFRWLPLPIRSIII